MRLSRILPAAILLGLGAWAIRKLIRARSAREEEPPFDDEAEILIIEEDIVPLH